MEVGIITFHRALNYGAVLQAYALQTKLQDMGNEVYIIDYRNKKIEQINSIIRLDGRKRRGVIIKELLAAPFRWNRRNKFNKYIKERLNLYSNFEPEEMGELCDKFDQFIVGSDQVWNPVLTGDDTTYFLNFVDDNEKKNSYAASIGLNNLTEEYYNELKENLLSFRKISVRENSAKLLLDKIVEKDIDVVIDPTLLLESNQYTTTGSVSKKKYILVYSLNTEINLMKEVISLAEKKNLSIYYVCNELYDLKKNRDAKVRHILNPSPNRFIDLIANAEYVATNSFHGTVFSIIFHKQFMCEVDYGVSYNSRIQDLLQECGLIDRIINSKSNFDDLIEWDQVDTKIDRLRKDSLECLKTIVNK